MDIRIGSRGRYNGRVKKISPIRERLAQLRRMTAISPRSAGKRSVVNQGFLRIQPVLRQDGCGSGQKRSRHVSKPRTRSVIDTCRASVR